MLDRYIKQNEELKSLNTTLEVMYKEERFEDYVNKFCQFLKTTKIDIQNMSVIDNFYFFCSLEKVIQLGGMNKTMYIIETCKNDTLKILIEPLNSIKE